MYCTVYRYFAVHYTVYKYFTVHCIVYRYYTEHCTVYRYFTALYSPQVLDSALFSLQVLYSALYSLQVLYSALYSLQVQFCPNAAKPKETKLPITLYYLCFMQTVKKNLCQRQEPPTVYKAFWNVSNLNTWSSQGSSTIIVMMFSTY